METFRVALRGFDSHTIHSLWNNIVRTRVLLLEKILLLLGKKEQFLFLFSFSNDFRIRTILFELVVVKLSFND